MMLLRVSCLRVSVLWYDSASWVIVFLLSLKDCEICVVEKFTNFNRFRLPCADIYDGLSGIFNPKLQVKIAMVIIAWRKVILFKLYAIYLGGVINAYNINVVKSQIYIFEAFKGVFQPAKVFFF